ncbi:drosulfakinins [Aedes aegypti]|uniref:Uncharacterized protein n=1 Tax=Aedes aegypti TaxID=7159 RepID=A0A6I8TD07_AEDAE|nr:drosulfakinins [Aedes aegypti]
MARLTLSILISLTIYFTYQAVASEALSTSGVRSSSNSQSTRSSEAMESLLGRDDGLNKLQSVWFKNVYSRRSAGPVGPGHIGTYTVLQRSPAGGSKLPLAYVADINFIDDEDIEKRFDDYGHMRFGKRGGGGEGEQFDDYGHMRFGRR